MSDLGSNPSESESPHTARRTFIAKMSGFASAASLFLLGCSSGQDQMESANSGVTLAHTTRPRLVDPSRATLLYNEGDEIDVPPMNLTYIPSNYRFFGAYRQRPDGFGGGRDELSRWYRSTTAERARLYPLCFYATKRPIRALGGTATVDGEPIQFTAGSGEPVVAVYFNGAWSIPNKNADHPQAERTPYWDISNRHSVVWESNGLSLGIRGSRVAAIDVGELIKIASGVTFI